MTAFRDTAHAHLAALLACEDADLNTLAKRALAQDAVFDISAPFEPLVGRDAIVDGFFRPLRSALTRARRRDAMFIGGDNIREEGGTWCASVCHYVGNFDNPFAGLAPSKSLVFLRSGEFYRVENGQISKARIILDLPDLLLQAGRMPFPRSYGTEVAFPVPETQDGILPTGPRGTQSLDLVQRMLANLHKFDPDTHGSVGQTGSDGAWDEGMLWYGPAGIGSNYLWSGFVKDHRASFLIAFPDRKGGNHYCRIGDGDYAAVSGWPSMTMTHAGDYLGLPATGRKATLRVMDFYRCDYREHPDGKIAENWVMLDYVDLFRQLGRDLIAEDQARSAS